MAFKTKNLSVMACANGFTLWHYTSEDVLDEMINGYFNSVAELLRKNDMFIINAGDQNAILFVKEVLDRNVKLG